MKLAACDRSPTNRRTICRLPVSADIVPVTSDVEEPTSAVEAVRYLFLAKELRRLGQAQAADRWEAQAIAWLARLSPHADD